MAIERRLGRALTTLVPLIAVPLLVVTSTAAPLPATPAQVAPQPDPGAADESAGEPVDKPGFFGEYFPLFPDKDLAAPVDDNKVAIYLLNLLPFGGLWGPLLVLPSEGRPPVGGDVIVPYLVPYLGTVAANVVIWVVSAAVNVPLSLFSAATSSFFPPFACIGCLGIPCGLVGCAVCIASVPTCLWVAPTASINAWGRAYKKAASSSALLPQPDQAPTPAPAPAPAPAPDAKKESKKKDDKKSSSDDAWVPY